MTAFMLPDLDPPVSFKCHEWHLGATPLVLEKPLAAAIGNFDGVHAGHQSLIRETLGHDGLDAAVITFNPHPRRFFAPDKDGFSLADHGDKLAFLAACGIDHVISVRFDHALRQTSAADFITEILPALGVRQLHAGDDFAFGNDRSGNMDLVSSLGGSVGITACPYDLHQEMGEVVSSSRIRQALAEGDMALTRTLLGRPYIMSGAVISGDQRGGSIGFPTANLHCPEMQAPRYGVYTVAVRLADQPDCPVHAGVANFGRRPTVEDRGVLLEANLFDYDGDLYGQRLNVMLLDFIRPEQAFDGIEALKEQINKDVAEARAFHEDQTGLIG
jgi:riboflavin kinase/FMN adenylyltransferase